MSNWGYKKGEGRFYKRVTGTIRFPDDGTIKSSPTGLKLGLEKSGHNVYGLDKGKPKKVISKQYKTHKVKTKRGVTIRGGYTRRLM